MAVVNPMPPPSTRGLRVFLYLFIFVGVLSLGFGGWNLFGSLQCAHWPTAGGVVVGGEIQRNPGSAENGDTYSAEVTYQYMVAGRHYEGNRLAFGAMSSSTEYAQRILGHYPVGQKVTVHYSPADPEQAVLETGVHGGTWVCFAVGTVFVMAGVMFLQLNFPATGVPMTGGATPLPVQGQPGGGAATNRPPFLMGVLFMLMGSFVFFMEPEPTGGTPVWFVYAIGGLFVVGGLFLLLCRLENKLYSKLMIILLMLAFLAIFHWISFGAGERIGTATTPFSVSRGVNVRTPFAVFTVLLDLGLLGGAIHWLLKRRGK